MSFPVNDLSAFLRSGLTLQDLYKMPGLNNFGKNLLPERTAERAEQLNKRRKQTRTDALLKRRNISASQLSPCDTPERFGRRKSPMKNAKIPKSTMDRLEKLQQWRQMKLARQQCEKEKKKPPFKAGTVAPAVCTAGVRSLRSRPTPANTDTVQPVKPRNQKLVEPERSAAVRTKAASLSSIKETARTTTYRTRSQTNASEDKKLKSGKQVSSVTSRSTKQAAREPKTKTKKKPVEEEGNKSVSPEYPSETGKVTELKTKEDNHMQKEDVTPKKASPPVYISPYVTVSRGKNSTRKEDVEERGDIAKNRSPLAGAAYFMHLLNEQVDRLQEICRQWENYKQEENPPEEACDMINVAIGQSQLLINKKFEQFRGLIHKCKSRNSEAPVTCEDLHGFWDMVYIQVGNLDKRFENLEKLRANNWEEIVPERKTTSKVKPLKKKTAKSNANLRDIIKAARELRKEQEDKEDTNTFDAVFFSVVSPRKDKTNVNKTPRRSARKSLLDVVLTRSHKSSSPGLQVLRASMNAKQVTEGKTPAKGILKLENGSAQRKKTVLFQSPGESDSNKENETTTDETFIRRSGRLRKYK